MRIRPHQLKALQTLFGLYWRRSLDPSDGDVRTARLAWASQNVGRPIASFTELRTDEAAQLIDLLKRALGQEVRPVWRRPRDRRSALAAGTHGRRNRKVSIEILAAPADIEEVNGLRERIGMTPEEFETWLASRSSPVNRERGAALRTLSDCNRVRWAAGNSPSVARTRFSQASFTSTGTRSGSGK